MMEWHDFDQEGKIQVHCQPSPVMSRLMLELQRQDRSNQVHTSNPRGSGISAELVFIIFDSNSNCHVSVLFDTESNGKSALFMKLDFLEQTVKPRHAELRMHII